MSSAPSSRKRSRRNSAPTCIFLPAGSEYERTGGLLQSNLQAVEAPQRILAASREYLGLVGLRYVNGISGIFEVLDAQRHQLDPNLQPTQLKVGTHASVIERYRALVGGRQPE